MKHLRILSNMLFLILIALMLSAHAPSETLPKESTKPTVPTSSESTRPAQLPATTPLTMSSEDKSLSFTKVYSEFVEVEKVKASDYPTGIYIFETETDWYNFMEHYIPNWKLYIIKQPDFSKQKVVYHGSYSVHTWDSKLQELSDLTFGVDVKEVLIENGLLKLNLTGTGVIQKNTSGNQVFYTCFIAVDKNELPTNVGYVYHQEQKAATGFIPLTFELDQEYFNNYTKRIVNTDKQLRRTWNSSGELSQSQFILFFTYNYRYSYGFDKLQSLEKTYQSPENPYTQIPAEIIENFLLQYFDVPVNVIREGSAYDKEKNVYNYLGVGSEDSLERINHIYKQGNEIKIAYDALSPLSSSYDATPYGTGILTIQKENDVFKYISHIYKTF